jgi:hypothetical protein
MAALLFHATLSHARIALRLAATPSRCTAAAAVLALDRCDDLLQAIDDWLATELDWCWQGPDLHSPAFLSPTDHSARAADSPAGAIAEVAVHGDSNPGRRVSWNCPGR